MKLAVNYSTGLECLIRAESVKVDLVKSPEWENLVNASAAIGKVYVHFDISLGNGTVKKLDLDVISKYLQTTDTPHLNCHLNCPSGSQNQKTANALSVRKAWETDLRYLKNAFPNQGIICENLPAIPYEAGSSVSALPDLITSFVEENDLGFLLDLSHARITALNLGWDTAAYLEKLPLHRLEELHLTGVRKYRGYYTDHFEFQEDDWHWVRWAHEQIINAHWQMPKIVAFEYGGVGEIFAWRSSTEALASQVPLLYSLFGEKPLPAI